jgi:hypothetical protein
VYCFVPCVSLGFVQSARVADRSSGDGSHSKREREREREREGVIVR